MTTLVIDCFEQKVYSDDCATCRDVSSKSVEWLYYEKDFQKVWKEGDYIICGTGAYDTITDFVERYPAMINIPRKGRHANIFVTLKVEKGLKIIEFKTKEVVKWGRKKMVWDFKSYIKTEGWITAGSGGEYAMACLHSGKTPEEAIKITSTLDTHTSGVVSCVEFN